MFASRFKGFAQRVMAPVARALGRTPISPNVLTITGLVLNAAVGLVLAMGNGVIGGFLVLFAGVFDMLDGALARTTGKTSTFGALLDSTLDRYSEAVLLFGLLVAATQRQNTQEIFLIFAVLVGSVMVSYVRARAEGLGLDCEVGVLPRPERVILLALGLIFGLLVPVLWVLAVLTNVTAIQRIIYVWQMVEGGGAKPAEGKQPEGKKPPEIRPPQRGRHRPAARLTD